jgi:flagellar biosynthesis/type III secretory pathway M-ring protein FliF/YscJ
LDTEGIQYSTDEAGRVLVPKSDRQVIQVRLATESSVPPSDLDWTAMMKDETAGSIWDSPEVQKQRERRFSMTLLMIMISNLNFVSDAQVAIDEPDQLRGPGRGFFPATASVTVNTVEGVLTGSQARTIRSIVAAGVSGMTVDNVAVTDQMGTLFAGRDNGAAVASQLEETARGVEAHFEKGIQEVLGIPGLRVAVSALAEPRTSFETGREHGEPTTASRRSAIEIAKERGSRGSGGRPGFGSNVGPRANAPLGMSPSQQLAEFESESRDNDVIVDATDHAIENPGGYVYKLSAILNVPRAYVLQRFNAKDNGSEPGSQEIEALESEIRNEFEGAISMMLQTTPPANDLDGKVVAGDVTVIFGLVSGPDSAYGSPPLTSPGGALASSMAMASDGGGLRPWYLSGLALLAIGAMLLVVRRATRHEQLPTAEELLGEPPNLRGEVDMVLGEANEIDPPLDARELDDEELRRKQMLEQLNELVIREPGEAAVLVKQWVRQVS